MKTDGMSNAARLFWMDKCNCAVLWHSRMVILQKNYLELLSSAIVVNSHIVKKT